MAASLLDQFLKEEGSRHVWRLLEEALASRAPIQSHFEFNRFELTIRRGENKVLIEDVLDATQTGTQTVSLAELAARLSVLTSLEAKLRDVIAGCRGLGVPPGDLDEMMSLNEAGEFGVALENLCTQLHEYDAIVPRAVLDEIRALGEAMFISADYWEDLRGK